MKLSDLPTKFPLIWGASAGAGYIRDIPVNSQIGITNGAASLETGFPPLNFLPVGSGGVPPFGQDSNGILRQITAWSQWQNVGGTVPWDASFSSEIGGYPKGAFVASAITFGLFWLCTADDNTTNPDAGGSGWQSVKFVSGTTFSRVVCQSSQSVTVPDDAAHALVQAWGAGGGGGGSSGSNAGFTGGGGEYRQGVIAVTPGTSITATVGVGGVAGNAAGSDGGNGSASTFSSITANPGGGGSGSAGAGNPGSGGSGGSGGNMSFPGTAGESPVPIPGGFLTLGGGGSFGSGHSHMTSSTSSSQNGRPGIYPGQGAGAGVNGGVGGVGANGLIIVQFLP